MSLSLCTLIPLCPQLATNVKVNLFCGAPVGGVKEGKVLMENCELVEVAEVVNSGRGGLD
jgi:hypothetical protein